MANIAGCCLTSYCLKETGKKDFLQSEMVAILEEIKKRAPDVTVDEIFFTDKVVILRTKAI